MWTTCRSAAARRITICTQAARGKPGRAVAARAAAARGFKKKEYGMNWYPTKDELLQSHPGPVLVGTSYETRKQVSKTKQTSARKYASFNSHEEYWGKLIQYQQEGVGHNLHEVIPADAPRALYFDLDGPPAFGEFHNFLTDALSTYVRWFFDGTKSGWSEEACRPVVLKSSDPTKYSAHVVFPEVQFDNHDHQMMYVPSLLHGMSSVTVDLYGEEVPVLNKVVDPVPYNKFQLLRGPYACKLKDGALVPDTCLKPEDLFREDPHTCFAGYVDRQYALPLPPMEVLLAENEVLREHVSAWDVRLRRATGRTGVNFQDQMCLFAPDFQLPGGGVINFAGMGLVDQFEMAIKYLHPDRASHFWSWFRMCGVTCSMLQRCGADDSDGRSRVWRAFLGWSAGYKDFCARENMTHVENAQGKHVGGLNLLLRLVRYDNPEMRVVSPEEARRAVLLPRASGWDRRERVGAPRAGR